MNTSLRSLLLAAATALGATALPAQLTLENFSAFQSANTFFYGDWANADPFGDLAPAATFSQAVGSYKFAGAANADSASAERAFAAPLNLAGYDLLAVSVRLLSDNAAESFTVFLVDANYDTAFATFQTGAFSTGSFTVASLAFTASGSFDLAAVTAFRLSGNDPFGGPVLSVDFDTLGLARSVVTPPPANNPVPEPATYGLAAAAGMVALVFARRRARSAV